MIQSAALSDPGLKRRVNEDCFEMNQEMRLYQIADGMGGHAAGEKAAKLTVDTITNFVDLAETRREITWPFGYNIGVSFEYNVLNTAVQLANRRVFQVSNQMPQYTGMGSTTVAVWVRDEERAFYAHIGDSRLYHLRESRLRQLTQDHTLVQEQLRSGVISGDELRDHSLRHVLTRAIGMEDKIAVDIGDLKLRPGDTLLLCSDGLTDGVEADEIQRLLLIDAAPEETCRTLVEAACDAGGRDNVTVVLIRSY